MGVPFQSQDFKMLTEFINRLSPWELSFLGIMLWSIGAVILATALLVFLFSYLKSKKGEVIIFSGLGAVGGLVILWMLSLLTFVCASFVGWEKGILLVLAILAAIAISLAIAIKALLLFEKSEKHRPTRKFNVFSYLVFPIGVCIFVFTGAAWLVIQLIGVLAN